jgi:hypothetical protein
VTVITIKCDSEWVVCSKELLKNLFNVPGEPVTSFCCIWVLLASLLVRLLWRNSILQEVFPITIIDFSQLL